MTISGEDASAPPRGTQASIVEIRRRHSASRRTLNAADAHHQARFRRELIIQALPGTVAATLTALGLARPNQLRGSPSV
ncbi:hypothetical protein U91I_03486 [alpha proteobacterium U9-1i]|nr:hypothetical protein U91I_03486 [alpha proteobacterium U9-1i]